MSGPESDRSLGVVAARRWPGSTGALRRAVLPWGRADAAATIRSGRVPADGHVPIGAVVEYVWFSLGFFLIHLGAYAVAGALNQQLLTKHLYGGEDALLAPFFRDMEDPEERRRSGRLMVPAQLVRALLMSVVLFPVLGAIGDLSYGVRFAFLAGLMFVYADVAAATPFSNNIEGRVYLQARFTSWDAFWRIQSEAVVYSLLFGGVAAWLLF
jgi:hypothetical protein